MRYFLVAVVFALGCKTANKPARDLSVSTGDLALPAGDGGACGATPTVKLTAIVPGLNSPTYMTGVPGDSTRLFVLERAGAVRVVKSGSLSSAPFLDLSPMVAGAGNDDGLLGIAFHPDYANNGRFWVDYSDTKHDLIVSEYARASADSAATSPTKNFLTLTVPAQVRFGGQLVFGPDGYLYIGVGDGAADGDPTHNALNLGLQLGKILRIDVDGFPTPPPGNMTGTGVDPQIWDYGFREPWRFSFDSKTGELYIADVGHPTYQEIDIEPKASGGRNYGWSTTAASHCLQGGCDTSGITLPSAEYAKAGGCAIIGGYVYRGSKNPCLTGWYVYSDYCSAGLHAISWDGSAVASNVEVKLSAGRMGQPSSFGQDDDGELYEVDYADGILNRLDSP